MDRIYFDNAATTYPKPDRVAEAVCSYIKNNGMNVGRGAYTSAFRAAEAVYETRELLCALFGFTKPSNVVFTANVTEALNIVIKGFLKKGDHVLVSSLEHNSVMRPLIQTGADFDRIPCDSFGRMLFDEGMIKENTKAVIITHASNMCGTINPAAKIGGICRKKGVKFILDCAQTGGAVPVSMSAMNIDALCFTGHKGLYGPQGTGGFILTDEMASLIEPLISGGTGSMSNLETIPDFMPDRFEAGTLNLPGIYGLKEGLKFIEETGIEKIREHEMSLTAMFIDGIKSVGGYNIVGTENIDERTAVVSLGAQWDIAETAFTLDRDYSIMTRVGMHCAPSAHKSLGTYPEGTLRFSFGWYNNEKEIKYALKALKEIKEKA